MTTAAAVDSATTTEGCRFCWMCRQACPVGLVTARETYTPHAWALLIESVKRGQLTWTDETADALYACADCGLCQAHCATDRPLPDAVVASRAGLVARQEAPGAVADVAARLRTHANAYAAVPPAPDVARGPLALFVGDAGAHLAPTEIDAVRRLVRAAGQDVVALGTGRSSGLLASSLGLSDLARDQAAAVLEAVAASGAREVLVLGAGDHWTFSHVYARRLGLAWPDDVIVRAAADWMAEAVEHGRLRLDPADEGPYAYVDPCHAARVPSTRRAPRALLARAFGAAEARELFWREGRAHPCGSVGGLAFTHPALAEALTDARLADGRASGAGWLVTDDPACLSALRQRAGTTPVFGLYERLAERVRG